MYSVIQEQNMEIPLSRHDYKRHDTEPPTIEAGSKVHDMDAVVVGMGALGLMLAKRLTDFGQSVAVVEQSPTLANGPSIKNHGWLHTGVVHSLSAQDVPANSLVKKLQYGHNFFSSYAPECLDEPFDPTYAVTKDEALAERARERWSRLGVPYEELTAADFSLIESDTADGAANYFFETTDSRINNRLLFAKLLTDIQRRGAAVLTAASYECDDDQTITVSSDQEKYRIRSPLFFYATGNNLGESYEKLTDEKLAMEYWKSHLLILPRITEASIIGLDRHSPIIINHGNKSVVNRSYDEVPISVQDTTPDPDEVALAFDTLTRDYPNAKKFAREVLAIACLKPHISSNAPAARHSVGEIVYEPKDGHIFALPGKMTEAPYVADSLIRRAYSDDRLNVDMISKRPLDAA
jgi:glycine/D-amino acid oxidase-like deaminating enzyme